jgi:hypothetical protein
MTAVRYSPSRGTTRGSTSPMTSALPTPKTPSEKPICPSLQP